MIVYQFHCPRCSLSQHAYLDDTSVEEHRIICDVCGQSVTIHAVTDRGVIQTLDCNFSGVKGDVTTPHNSRDAIRRRIKEGVEVDYKAGDSIRGMSKKYGITPGTIREWAAKYGWQRGSAGGPPYGGRHLGAHAANLSPCRS